MKRRSFIGWLSGLFGYSVSAAQSETTPAPQLLDLEKEVESLANHVTGAGLSAGPYLDVRLTFPASKILDARRPNQVYSVVLLFSDGFCINVQRISMAEALQAAREEFDELKAAGQFPENTASAPLLPDDVVMGREYGSSPRKGRFPAWDPSLEENRK